MPFDKRAFIDFMLDNGVVGFFPEGRKLKSGRVSHWYANCRVLGDTAGSLETLAGYVLDFVEELGIEFDCFFGVPEGGTKAGIACSLLRGCRTKNPGEKIIMGRGRAKEHGDPRDRFLIGSLQAGDRLLVLEDVTTTGGSMLEALNGLKEAGAVAAGVVALANRLEKRDDGLSVAEKVGELGIPYHAMSTAEDLLPEYIRREPPPAELVKRLENDFRLYGVKALKLS